MGNDRNTKTTHPKKSARRMQALARLSASKRAETYAGRYELAALRDRAGKPPRHWQSPSHIKAALAFAA